MRRHLHGAPTAINPGAPENPPDPQIDGLITDSNAAWPANLYIGATVTLTNDENQHTYKITANTATTLTVVYDSTLDEFIEPTGTTYKITAIYTYATDAQGNVVALTNANGTILEKIKYDVYGRLTGFEYWNGAGYSNGDDNEDGIVTAAEYYACSLTKNPYLFQSQRLDPETGLYYFKNRYYDPVHGRFISRDPAGMTDGPNLYAFVNNDPINFVDPLGLACEVLPPSWYWEVSGGGGELDFLWGAASRVGIFGAAIMGGMVLETIFCGPQMEAAMGDPELQAFLDQEQHKKLYNYDAFYYPTKEESDQAYLNSISKKSYLEMSDDELKFVWEHAPGRFGLFWYQAQTDKVGADWQKEHPSCDIFFARLTDPDLCKELDDKIMSLFFQSQGEEAEKAGYELVEKMRRIQQAIDNYAGGVIDVNGLAQGGWTTDELEFIKKQCQALNSIEVINKIPMKGESLTYVYNPATNQIIVGQGLHPQLMTSVGWINYSQLVGGFARINDNGVQADASSGSCGGVWSTGLKHAIERALLKWSK